MGGGRADAPGLPAQHHVGVLLVTIFEIALDCLRVLPSLRAWRSQVCQGPSKAIRVRLEAQTVLRCLSCHFLMVSVLTVPDLS